MKWLASCVLVALALAAAGCAKDEQPSLQLRTPVCDLSADLGGKQVPVEVRWQTWLDAMARQAERDRALDPSISFTAGTVREHEQRALRQSVADQLWIAAARGQGKQVGDAQLDEFAARAIKERFAGDEALMAEVLALQGYGRAAWREHLRAELSYRSLDLNQQQAQDLTNSLRGDCKLPRIDLDGGAYPGERRRVKWNQALSQQVFAARPDDQA